MNRNYTHVLCLVTVIGTSMPGWAAPVPEQNPFDAPANSPSAPTPNPALERSKPAPGMPELPTTAPVAAAPEGLNGSMTSLWNANQLTGDWGGFRDKMKNAGVVLTPTLITEVFGNPTGGMGQGVIIDGLFNVALDLNLDRMSDSHVFDDMLIHANAMYIYGAGLSSSFVGDFSNTSNIAGYNSVRLQELWLQKQFWEKRISLRAGNMAVDAEFFTSNSSALFINGTFGAFTLIGNNVPNAPIYPVASPGVRVEFLPTSNFYFMAGVYGMDVNSEPDVNNKHGTRFALDGASGMLVMSEAGYLLNQSPNDRGLQGTYKLGSFVHTANYTTWASQANAANGTGDLKNAGTNYGVYGVMDQQLLSNGENTISLFVRSGAAPTNVNFVDYYVDGGFNFSGFIPGRMNDVAGIAVARSHVSTQYSDFQVATGSPISTAETVIEATYKLQIAPWWTIQPDIQYCITPSGVQGSDDAVSIGLRTNVTF